MSDTTETMRAAPCPFCGAVGLTFSQGSTHRWINAECVGCEASPGEFRTEQDCIAAWNRRAAAAPAVTNITHTEVATSDQLIELTAHLERRRAAAIAETVRVLPIGGHDADAPTPFHAGFALACEEIAHRLQTEAWGMLPNGGWGPTGAANEDDRPSPEFPELLRRALAAQPSPERNDCEPVISAQFVRACDVTPGTPEVYPGQKFVTGDEKPTDDTWLITIGNNTPPAQLAPLLRALRKAARPHSGVHACTTPGDDADGWMPIETAPKKGKSILVFAPNERFPIYIAHWFEWKLDRSRNGWQVNGNVVRPTHWRPLPTPPATATKDPQR